MTVTDVLKSMKFVVDQEGAYGSSAGHGSVGGLSLDVGGHRGCQADSRTDTELA